RDRPRSNDEIATARPAERPARLATRMRRQRQPRSNVESLLPRFQPLTEERDFPLQRVVSRAERWSFDRPQRGEAGMHVVKHKRQVTDVHVSTNRPTLPQRENRASV